MIELSFWQIFVRASAALVILTVHGAVFAGLARVLGDGGPRKDGRLTLNPVAHVSLWAVVAAVFGRVGWIRPVTLDPARLAGRRLGVLLCLLGGLAAIWALGALALALRPLASGLLSPGLSISMNDWLTQCAALCGWICVLGLIPLPPLPGGYLLQALAPGLFDRIVTLFRRRELAVSLGLVAVFWAVQSLGVADVLRPVVGLLGLGGR